jgi:hypothetical protein
MGVSALLGAVALFVNWGPTSHDAPLYRLQNLTFSDTGPMLMGLGAIALGVSVLMLAASAIVALQGPGKGLNLALNADIAAFIAVALFAIGFILDADKNQARDKFPLGVGFWLGLAMVVAAFVGPVFMRQARPAPGTASPAAGAVRPVPAPRPGATPARNVAAPARPAARPGQAPPRPPTPPAARSAAGTPPPPRRPA